MDDILIVCASRVRGIIYIDFYVHRADLQMKQTNAFFYFLRNQRANMNATQLLYGKYACSPSRTSETSAMWDVDTSNKGLNVIDHYRAVPRRLG